MFSIAKDSKWGRLVPSLLKQKVFAVFLQQKKR